MKNERLSEPPAGMLNGTFAPEILNPDVVALTELMVQEKKGPFVIIRVFCTDSPPTAEYPETVLPFTPQALSLDTMFIAVTVTSTPLLLTPLFLNAAAAMIATTTTTATTATATYSRARDLFGGGCGGA
jgi:hypothetical protein